MTCGSLFTEICNISIALDHNYTHMPKILSPSALFFKQHSLLLKREREYFLLPPLSNMNEKYVTNLVKILNSTTNKWGNQACSIICKCPVNASQIHKDFVGKVVLVFHRHALLWCKIQFIKWRQKRGQRTTNAWCFPVYSFLPIFDEMYFMLQQSMHIKQVNFLKGH